MNTKKYLENPYLREWRTRVLSIEGKSIVLEESIFYPEGGGQPADRGILVFNEEEFPVADVQENGKIWISLEKEPSFSLGQEVLQKIDFDWRYENMKAHTGEHIFSGLVKTLYGGENVGFHISEGYFSCDYDIALTLDQVENIERIANRKIQENKKVRCYYPDGGDFHVLDYRSKKEIDGPIRITEIDQVDYCACCGTHVIRTGEVGRLKVISVENYKGGIRCIFKTGMNSVEDGIQGRRILETIARAYSSNFHDLPRRLEKERKEILDLKNELKKLKEERVNYLVQSLPEDPIQYIKRGDLSMEEGRKFINKALKNRQALFLELEKDQFILAANKIDVKDVFQKMGDLLRGGGSSSLVQGKILGEGVEEIFYQEVGKSK